MPADAHVAEADARPAAGGALGWEIRRLGTQTLIYGLGGVALQVAGIVTLPVFARHFSPADYGILELGMVTAAILMIAVDAGMASASQRSYYDHGDDEEAIRRRILTTALVTQLAVGVVLAALLALSAGTVSDALFAGRDVSGLLILVGASLPAFAAAQFAREILRLEFRAWSYLASSVAGAAVGTAISVLAVLAWDLGVEGPFVGALAGWVVGALYGVALVWRRVTARPSRRELAKMLRFGLPLIPTALCLWALSLIDRVMLARLADLDELGQYAIANRVAVPVLLIVTALGLALSPFVLSIYQTDPEREKRVRARVLTDFTAALVLVALVTSLWAREITELVAPGFDTAYRAVGVVAFGLVAFGVSSVVVVGVSISRQTKWLTVYSALAAGLNVAANLVLIPPLGQLGAALATLLAYGVLTGLYFHRAQKLYPTPYRRRPVLATFVLGLALVPVGVIDYDAAPVAWGVKVAVLLAFVCALRPLGVIGRGDVARAVEWLRRR